MTYWTDGGYNNLKKRGGIYCITDGNEFCRIQKIIVNSSNEAEYFGMIETLRIANPGDTIYSDSQLTVNQLINNWQVRAENLKHFWQEAHDLIENKFKGNIKIKWIRRNKNLAGIVLEKRKTK